VVHPPQNGHTCLLCYFIPYLIPQIDKVCAMPNEERLNSGSIPLEPGWYEELDIDGTPTGVWVSVAKGERLPANPSGSLWRKAVRPRQASPATDTPR
jgi:hypothetical protein